ncbi:MAG: dihydroorotate dehydrogenase [Deltaproteobacteria bacterium]|nr:dihydroorotate dehydrogenase [Candidatus Zymogenaceae bacterium]
MTNPARPDMSVELFGVRFKNRVMGASGTVGYGLELLDSLDISRIGAVVTKGISALPKRGNPPPRICETPAGVLNSIGLENIGAERFIIDVLPELSRHDTNIIANIFGETMSDYQRVASMFRGVKEVCALEVNLSCPNVKKGSIAFGRDPDTAARLIKKVKKSTDKPIIAKLTPNITDIVPLARSVQRAGADGVSLINTLIGMAVDVEKRRAVFKNITAGLSGPAVRPVALRMVWEAASNLSIPVIGIGGIGSARDALEFIMAGASAIQVGTANFTHPGIMGDIVEDMETYIKDRNINTLDTIQGIITRKHS